MQKSTQKKLFKAILTGILAGLGTFIALKPKASLAAERISFSLPIFGEFHLSVDSLETFAKEGEITREFNFYAKRFDEKSLNQLRRLLQKQFDLNPVHIHKLTNSPIGERFFRNLGEVISTHPQSNGLYAIRSAILLAASDSEGLSVINVMRHFPTDEIQINASLIFSLIEETSNFLAYNDSTVEAISQIAKSEAASEQKVNFDQLSDLRQSGPYSVSKKTMIFGIDRLRQTGIGLTDSYKFETDVYLPQGQTQPAPLAVLTHGFISGRSHFNYLGQHLASHGYIVLVPEHIGSDSKYKEAFLRGELNVDVSPIEFESRPLDITYLLNRIENDSELNQLINWSQVGVLGHSFGGNTALAIAGASLNRTRINQICAQNEPDLNISMLLQCRASVLPPGRSDFSDARIKAVVGVNPMTSSILGPESLGEIEIPTMILAGSQDKVTPFIDEQAHPFLWLNTKNKYLGVMVGGTHNSTSNPEGLDNLPELFIGPRPDLARSYLKAMSLAFFEVYLRERNDYQPYLSSAYTQAISNQELPFYLVKSLTVEQLAAAYGDTPPTPPIPEAVVATSPQQPKNIIANIRENKQLKVAMRSDAAPFGYIDEQNNIWTGYCSDLADSLGEYLAKKLDIDSGIEVIKLPSNLENRFELVQNNTVHLECGPNTVTQNDSDTSFSNFYWISGTRFLVTNNNAAKIDPDSALEGIKTGVLQDSTTVDFLQQTYPKAKTVLFEGEKGRIEGVEAITNGTIDAFVSDGVLLSGEINRQNLPTDNYQLIPQQPLTCDFYGLIVPKNARKFSGLVNDFLKEKSLKQIQEKWLKDDFDQAISDAEYCLNKQTN